MFMRLVHHKVKPEEVHRMREYYHQTIIPRLEQVKGCLSACLIDGMQEREEMISLTLWEAPEDARAYEQSGVFKELVDGTRPFLAESSEWKIQLSKDMILEYTPPGPKEPSVQTYAVVAASDSAPKMKGPSDTLYTRMVSVKLKPGKFDEYKHLYNDLVIPAFKQTPGCLYAYLIESAEQENEAHSITIWDSKIHADEYVSSGKFDELINQVKHTFSELFQWKMSLDRSKRERSTTSDDLEVSEFSVVTGKGFKHS